MTAVGFVTYEKLPQLTGDDRLVLPYLHQNGITTHPLVWNHPEIDWKIFDAIVVRSCWDYHNAPRQFYEWVDLLEELEARLWNPASILRWNANKTYLKELPAKGISIPSTAWFEQGSDIRLEDVLAERNWKKAVVKPVISASADHTWITEPHTARADNQRARRMLRRNAIMVQEFLAELSAQGEWSFIFFDKQYSHAVLKWPREGDFRVQEEFGGSFERRDPSFSIVDQAQKIVDVIDKPLLYARVDGIERDAALVLTELELIEPALFLSADAAAPARFADAILCGLKR